MINLRKENIFQYLLRLQVNTFLSSAIKNQASMTNVQQQKHIQNPDKH